MLHLECIKSTTHVLFVMNKIFFKLQIVHRSCMNVSLLRAYRNCFSCGIRATESLYLRNRSLDLLLRFLSSSFSLTASSAEDVIH